MTTGSSSARSPEYAISDLDPPTGETTTVTGAHTVRRIERAEVRDTDVWEPDLDEPALHDADFDEPALHDIDIDIDFDEPGHHEPGHREAAHREPAHHEPAHREFTDDESARRESADDEPVASAYGDPVGDLVRAAVADRPLEEVVDLITMLERSPQYAQATIDALRAVGVNRSVEDVTRLVGLLTRAPRHSDSADEVIRAAAECRSVEDVTRLMELLHRTPLEPHCGQEAVRAAATGRPVGELVQLIGRMAEDGRVRPDSPDARHLRAALDGTGTDDGPGPDDRPAGRAGVFARADRRGRERRGLLRPARRERDRDEDGTPRSRDRDRTPRDRDEEQRTPRDRDEQRTPRDKGRAARGSVRGASWPARLTVAVLAGCGVAYFPLHRDDASVRVYGMALAVSALCLLLALLLTVRPAAVPLLGAAVVGPAMLAAATLYGSATPSARLSRAAELTLAPAWIAVTVAALASLVALTALCVRLASQAPARRWAARPAAGAGRAAD